jgi:hypothetical protein
VFEIVGSLGVGGMGDVYRAGDGGATTRGATRKRSGVHAAHASRHLT